MTYKTIKLPENYKPSEKESFMCNEQKAYFFQKLTSLQKKLEDEANDSLGALKESDGTSGGADDADRANKETEQLLEMRQVDRNRKQIKQIQKAFARLDNNNYGYCIDTGEPISLKRLDVRLIATRTADAQANHEDNDNKFS